MRHASLLRHVGRRLLQAVPVLLAIAALNFVILQLAPGDIVDVLAGEAGAATPEYMAELRRSFGLDQPVWVQFIRYMTSLIRLELGFSFRQNMPVFDLIVDRLPATVLLMTAALVIAVVLGAGLGLLAAMRVYSIADGVIQIFVLISYAIPTFWLGLMAIVLFSARLGWLPSGGMFTIGADLSGWRYALDVARHLALPALTLSTFYLAVYTKLVRTAMLELYGVDYVRTARAKGLSKARVTLVHAFPNALLPMVTIIGYQVGSLLSGAVLVESVFSWPGLGRLAFESILARDFNLLLGILFLSSVLVVVINVLIDVVYALIDPRVNVGGGRRA